MRGATPLQREQEHPGARRARAAPAIRRPGAATPSRVSIGVPRALTTRVRFPSENRARRPSCNQKEATSPGSGSAGVPRDRRPRTCRRARAGDEQAVGRPHRGLRARQLTPRRRAVAHPGQRELKWCRRRSAGRTGSAGACRGREDRRQTRGTGSQRPRNMIAGTRNAARRRNEPAPRAGGSLRNANALPTGETPSATSA